MNTLAAAYEEVRTGLATVSSQLLPDLCELIAPNKTDQGAGHTITDRSMADGIPCSHQQLSGGGVAVNDGGTVVNKTHRLDMPFTSDTILIDRHYKIRVTARGFNLELIFEQPVIQIDSASPLLTVFAVLTEGYRQPGIT